MRAEADRMFRDEEKFLTEKLETTQAKIDEYEQKKESIYDDFFSGLPQSE